MFDEAAQEGALLLIDEVDGLFLARGQSSYRWELTQTSEFLAGLESYEGLLVCTTNQLERVDEAFMRRFDFKVGLGYLSEEQLAKLIESVCESGLESRRVCALKEIRNLTNATLGDLACVIRRLIILGSLPTWAGITAALSEHLKQKPISDSRIGFMARVERR